MNTTSLLITLVGIVVIIGLYLMSRIAQSKQPQIQQTQIPNLKNPDGSKFSSLLEDVPATDGSTPKPKPTQKVTITSDTDKPDTKATKQTKQIILFISANDENGLDGNTVEAVLSKNKLTLGEKNIYHYLHDNNSSKSSLFQVANGTDPWTLTAQDLQNKKLAGLSIIMSLPTQIENKKAVDTLLSVSKKVCSEINGTLKNQQQQELTKDNEKEFMLL